MTFVIGPIAGNGVGGVGTGGGPALSTPGNAGNAGALFIIENIGS